MSTDRWARELYEWLGREAKDLPFGGHDRARNDHKPRVLMDLLTSNMSTVILANKVIIVIAHPNDGQSL